MKVLNVIWKFVNSKLFGYVVIIVTIMLLAGQCKRNHNLKIENSKQEQNIAAADSVIKSYKDKEGNYVAEKTVWILTEKELKEQNKGLSDKVKNQTGTIISLNNTIFSLKQDTALLHDSIKYLNAIIGEAQRVNDSMWILPWELNYTWDANNYDFFKGHTLLKVDTFTHIVTHLNTLMDNRDSQIDLTFGEKVVDKKYNVYVESKYPGLSTKSMQGVFIDPNSNKAFKDLIEKQHWFTGFSISVGITSGYDFINQRPTIVVGPTIGYSIYQW